MTGLVKSNLNVEFSIIYDIINYSRGEQLYQLVITMAGHPIIHNSLMNEPGIFFIHQNLPCICPRIPVDVNGSEQNKDLTLQDCR